MKYLKIYTLLALLLMVGGMKMQALASDFQSEDLLCSIIRTDPPQVGVDGHEGQAAQSNHVLFFTLNGAYSNTHNPSIGFSVGQFGQCGWFVSVMSGLHFAGIFPDAQCDKYGYVNDILPFYKNEYAFSALSVIGGIVPKINDWASFKLGMGFGNRSLSWKTMDDRWVRNKAYSLIGVDVSAGLVFKMGHFVLTTEAVTTSLKSIEGKVGIGYSFNNNKSK